MKAIEWDGTAGVNKQVLTGRIHLSASEPGDIENGDLWIDSSSTPTLKAKVSGTIYELVGAAAAGYLEGITEIISLVVLGDTLIDGAADVTEDGDAQYPYAEAVTETPTVVLY